MLTGLSGMAGERSRGACKWIMDKASLKFKQVNPVRFREFVVALGLDYEEGFWLTLHKLVENWSPSLNEPKTRGN